MPFTTSAARRKPIWTFGVSTRGRPPLFRVVNSSGCMFANGLASAKSAFVHSGFSSSVMNGSGFFVIATRLFTVCPTEADDPHGRAANCVNNDVGFSVQPANECLVSHLTIVPSPVLSDDGGSPVERRHIVEG